MSSISSPGSRSESPSRSPSPVTGDNLVFAEFGSFCSDVLLLLQLLFLLVSVLLLLLLLLFLLLLMVSLCLVCLSFLFFSGGSASFSRIQFNWWLFHSSGPDRVLPADSFISRYLENHPYHHHLCHQHRHHHDHHHHPPPYGAATQVSQSASGWAKKLPTDVLLSQCPPCSSGLPRWVQPMQIFVWRWIGKERQLIFLPFSGRSRPSCPDGETGRVLENLDLRRGILHILQYKHLNENLDLQGREIQTNIQPSPSELDKNVGRRILHKVFYIKVKHCARDDYFQIFEYRLHYVTTDVNYLHQYLDEVKTVGKAFIQLGLRPGSIILMIMIILMITTGCTQIPISTLSHTWVFVRLYGIVFVIIVIIVIIIIMIIKSEGVNAQL